MAKVIFNRRSEETLTDVKSLSKEEFVTQYAEKTTAKAPVLEKFWEETNAATELEQKSTPASKPSAAVKKAVKKATGVEKAEDPIEVEETNQNVNKKLQKQQNDKEYKDFVDYLEQGDGLTDEKLQELSGDDQLIEAFVDFYGQLEPDTEEEEKRYQAYRHLYDNFGTLIRTEVYVKKMEKEDKKSTTSKPADKKASNKSNKTEEASKKPKVAKEKTEKSSAPSKRDIIRQIIEEFPECDNKFIKEQAPERGVATKIYDSEIYAVRTKLAKEAAEEK